MKAVVQRAKNASVSVEGKISGALDKGLLVYLGVASGDSEKDAEWMAEKVVNLRIFEDAQGKMNLSLTDVIAEDVRGDQDAEDARLTKIKTGILAVSQFTLLGDASKGRRPYYGAAAEPLLANRLYEYFMERVREHGVICEAGVFQAHMDVSYTNDGPVTILLDSKN